MSIKLSCNTQDSDCGKHAPHLPPELPRGKSHTCSTFSIAS